LCFAHLCTIEPSRLHAPRPTRVVCVYLLSLLLFSLLLLLLLCYIIFCFLLYFLFCFSFIFFTPTNTHRTSEHLRILKRKIFLFRISKHTANTPPTAFETCAPFSPFLTAVLTIFTPISTALFLFSCCSEFMFYLNNTTYVLIRWNNDCIA